MYRFLFASIVCAVISLITCFQLLESSQDSYLFGAFLVFICIYMGIVGVFGFLVARSIKKKAAR
jgi:hypothetical protein